MHLIKNWDVKVKSIPLTEEQGGIVLNNEKDKYLGCGEVLEDVSVVLKDPEHELSTQIDLVAGDKVYYLKKDALDTHETDIQIVPVSKIWYKE